MIYTEIGSKKISKIVLGGAGLGTRVSKSESLKLMDIYFEHGGNAFDTARVYCDWMKGGANVSEQTIGEWIHSRNIRDKVWISTKGGHPPIEHLQVSRINEKELTLDIEKSLYYLNIDYIDIYYLHRDAPQKPVEEIMPILDKFVKSGKIRYLGASNWTSARIEAANKFAKQNGLEPFRFNQIMWSYAKVNKEGEPDDTLRIMDEEEFEFIKKSDLVLMPYSSQAQGFYTLAAKNGVESLSERHKAKYLNAINLKRLEKLKRISKETGISPTAVSLNHVLRNSDVIALPIIGVSNEEFLLDSLNSLNLPEKYYAEITERDEDQF